MCFVGDVLLDRSIPVLLHTSLYPLSSYHTLGNNSSIVFINCAFVSPGHSDLAWSRHNLSPTVLPGRISVPVRITNPSITWLVRASGNFFFSYHNFLLILVSGIWLIFPCFPCFHFFSLINFFISVPLRLPTPLSSIALDNYVARIPQLIQAGGSPTHF